MNYFEKIDTRMDLMKTMAAACDRDISSALADGLLSGMALRSCAFRCYGCGHADECATLLKTGPSLTVAPNYCANREAFSRLPELQK